MTVRVPLSSRIYHRDCLNQAISAYSHICSINIFRIASHECHIEVEALPELEADESRAVHEFLNYLLDLSIEAKLGKIPSL